MLVGAGMVETMRRMFMAAGVFVIVMLLAISAAAASPDAINVSYVKAPFNLQIMVMQSKGMLEREFAADGITVNWREITSGAKQTQALAAGSLDIASVVNTTSVLLANAGGNPVRIIGGVSRPCESFAIVVGKDGPTSVAGLKGKTVAGPKGTVLHQLLVAALAREGLAESDVEFVQMNLPSARTAMLGGQVDAALLAASLVIKSVEAGARVLVTAKGLVTPILVSATSASFAAEHPDLVQRFMEVSRQAMTFIEQYQEEAIRIGAAEHGISVEDARTLFGWADFTTHLVPDDLKVMREDVAFLSDNGMLAKDVDPAALCLPEAFEK